MSAEIPSSGWRQAEWAGPVAVLIDGASFDHRGADRILKLAESLGPVVIRRVYGDVTRQRDWAEDKRFNPIHTVHKGENQSDVYLTMDALVIAEAGRAESFVVAALSADFDPVAQRLRDLGCVVHVLGIDQTSADPHPVCGPFAAVGG